MNKWLIIKGKAYFLFSVLILGSLFIGSQKFAATTIHNILVSVAQCMIPSGLESRFQVMRS